jgi:hypothetical protein
MPAGNTYEAIRTETLASAQASVTFSSIPSTYTDLVIVFAGTAVTGNNYMGLQFNGDTGNNYSSTLLRGNGTAAQSARLSNQPQADTAYGSPVNTDQNNIIVQIQNYSNTTTYKTMLSRSNSASVETSATVALWRNTAAITSIVLKLTSNNFASGSTFSLYGIKSA